MNTAAMAKATAWLNERLPDATLSDFAAMLAIGSAGHRMPVAELATTLGMPEPWLHGFIERQTKYHGGLAPLVQLHETANGSAAELSQVGHNILNQFWQRTTSEQPASAPVS
jgi:hypothetical protein